ncbi:MAG: CotH kinase family protein [Eubacteriales bacterium]|nr:CotH kinase family protein [Eubacteriales bacterium]
MRFKKVEIYVLTVLLAAVAAFFGIRDSENHALFFFVIEDTFEGTEEKVQIYDQGSGNYCVFLPSYANLDTMKIRTNRKLFFDEMPMRYGMLCNNIELGKKYQLSGKGYSGSIIFIKSENLPTLYVDTVSGNENYIHQQKDHKESGNMRLYTSDGALNYRGVVESIKMHRNNTSESDKKPYSLKLKAEGDLLGMGKAKKWVLLSNQFDVTQLRNKIVFDFAQDFGLDFTPKSQWVDVYLNGKYAGLYLLCEKNEVHPERVTLGKDGGALVSMELEYRLINQNLPYIVTEMGAPLRIHYSTMEDDKLKKIWQSAENAIRNEKGIDPETGKHWSELIDLDSWARKYLIEEIFGNIDGGRVSQFFYVDGSDSTGKIYAGPVWDYDLTMGNITWYENPVSNMLYVNCPYDFFGSPWYNKLCEDEQFFEYVVEIYQEEFLPLLDELLDRQLSEYTRYISQGVRMNQLRWKTDVWHNKDVLSETQKIEPYLVNRIHFLNNLWIKKQEKIMVSTFIEYRWQNYLLSPGDCLHKLPDYPNGSWYVKDTEVMFDFEQQIYQDVQLEWIADKTAVK